MHFNAWLAASCYNFSMHPLAAQIAEFLRQPSGADTFDALALAIFARQFDGILPYRRLCEASKLTPQTVTHWRQIPAVPASAFKNFALSVAPPPEIVAEWNSSGTTGALSSRHFLDADALALYELSLRRGFDAALSERPNFLLALMPPPSDALHSSLSHMLGALHADAFFWDDTPALTAALRQISRPVTLFGTAFAFVGLFDATDEVWRLPTGSIVVETGGFKGRTREVERGEFYAMISARLGVKTNDILSEYGMSEMASQFYGRGLDGAKRGPAWVRTRAIDAETGDDAPPGTPGLLRHFDLANWNSVSAIQTQDLGTLTTNGGFVLHGRAENAEVRGCSLTVEALWKSPMTRPE